MVLIDAYPSDLMARLLRRLSGHFLPLHSRFERSCNLLTGRALLLTVTDPTLGRSPYGLAADRELAPVLGRVARAGGIRLSGGLGWAGGEPVLRIVVDRPYVTTLAPQAARPARGSAAFHGLLDDGAGLHGLAALLQDWPLGQPSAKLGPGLPPWLRLAAPAVAAFTAGPPEGLAQAAMQLVGLGPGLTPSGDDFLLGFLAGRLAQGQQAEVAVLRRQLSRHVMRATNLISASYLRHGFRGRFATSVKRLLDSLHRAEVTDVELAQATNELRRLGATSGADVLLGVLAALYRFDLQDSRRLAPNS